MLCMNDEDDEEGVASGGGEVGGGSDGELEALLLAGEGS